VTFQYKFGPGDLRALKTGVSTSKTVRRWRPQGIRTCAEAHPSESYSAVLVDENQRPLSEHLGR
jgi:hypothetical protein